MPEPTPHHISDAEFLDAMRVTLELRPSSIGVTRWDVGAVLDGDLDAVRAVAEGDRRDWAPGYEPPHHEPVIPETLVLAKAKELIDRGVIVGCACGCRGDWEILANEEP